MEYSVVIEDSGFTVRDREKKVIENIAFGEVMTQVNRFKPSLVISDDFDISYFWKKSQDDPAALTFEIESKMPNEEFGALVIHLIALKAVAALSSCQSDNDSIDVPTLFAYSEELALISSHAHILCTLLSDVIINCDKSRKEVIDVLLNTVNASCSFMCEANNIKIAFSVSSLDSLLILDCLYCHQNDIRLNQCENCGRFFIPTTRSDEKYCPFRDDDGHECRKIGYENKIRTIPLDALYRKIYKTQNSRKNRNLKNKKDADSRFSRWVKYACDMKLRCEHEEISLDEFEKLISSNSWLKCDPITSKEYGEVSSGKSMKDKG